jgi:hypothetical protein
MSHCRGQRARSWWRAGFPVARCALPPQHGLDADLGLDKWVDNMALDGCSRTPGFGIISTVS